MSVGVGLIGFGLAGSAFHAPFVAATPGLRLDAVVTSDAGRAEAARSRYPEVVVMSTVEELLASDVGIVVVASPNRYHVTQAAAALAAGKHVVVDKPAAATAAEVRALAAAAAEADRVLTVFQNRRWDGDFLTVKSLVDSGRLGAVGRFESRFERSARSSRTAWKASTDPADLNDIVYDLGTHLVDQAQLLFGPAVLVHVDATGPRDATLSLTHAGGVRSHLRTSDSTVPVSPRFAVTGTEAGFRTWGLDPQERASRDGVPPTAPGFGAAARPGVLLGRDGDEEEVPLVDGHYLGYYAALAACVEGRGEPPVPLADSVDLAVTIDAALLSAATGAPVVPDRTE